MQLIILFITRINICLFSVRYWIEVNQEICPDTGSRLPVTGSRKTSVSTEQEKNYAEKDRKKKTSKSNRLSLHGYTVKFHVSGKRHPALAQSMLSNKLTGVMSMAHYSLSSVPLLLSSLLFSTEGKKQQMNYIWALSFMVLFFPFLGCSCSLLNRSDKPVVSEEL